MPTLTDVPTFSKMYLIVPTFINIPNFCKSFILNCNYFCNMNYPSALECIVGGRRVTSHNGTSDAESSDTGLVTAESLLCAVRIPYMHSKFIFQGSGYSREF